VAAGAVVSAGNGVVPSIMACVASKDGNIYDSSSDDMVRFVRFCVSRAKIIVLMSVRDAGSGALPPDFCSSRVPFSYRGYFTPRFPGRKGRESYVQKGKRRNLEEFQGIPPGT
jgi:hypothetical protein